MKGIHLKLKKLLKFNSRFLLVICIILILRIFFVPFFVIGPSMQPTLQNGNFGIAQKFRDIKRNDIVLIKNKATKKTIIKRVIGLPGEKVEYKDNKLYINDKEYKDKFSKVTGDYSITLADNQYCCLGDNRLVSADSRTFGSFSKDDIKSKVVIHM